MGAIRARIKYYEKSFLNILNKTKRFTKTNINHIFRLYATFSVAFLLSYVISGIISPVPNSSATDCVDGMIPGTTNVCNSSSADVNVSIVGAWSVAVSSSGTLNVDIAPSGSGTLSTAVDNVNIYTNTPNGYQLYLNATSGSTDIYNNNVLDESGNLDANLPSGTNTNHFSATTGTKASPASLVNNSWGYSLANNPSTFSKVEETSATADSLIRTTATKTTGSGDDIDVTYGFKADTKLTPGTYTTSVTYTAVAEVPSYSISSVSPNNFSSSDTNQQITIVTTAPSAELGLGDITARITDSTGTNTVSLTNCTETTQEVSGTSYRAANCTYPGGLPVSITNYAVELTSSWHNATYTLPNSITIYQTTMQNFTQTNCNNLTESTATEDHRIRLKDSRDGKFYNVSKLADGNCWMVQNLALDGGRTLHPSDSNVTQDRTLISNITTPPAEDSLGEAWVYSVLAETTDSYSSLTGNYYNWFAATATVGTNSVSQGTVYESICPNNWRLSDISGDKSFTHLLAQYGFPTTETANAQEYVSKIQQAPLFFPLAPNPYNPTQKTDITQKTRVPSTVKHQDYYYNYNMNATTRGNGSYNPANIYIRGSVQGNVRCVFGS